ncbi:hypothetical protein TrCOL_g5503 [Triparma columacea]|uniref:tRNA-guanine(15) transglycosylase-like domain-containing protein n=1 Tax=Triparma columacea TaxID=722753 RepID=A0A9W7GFS6_9STRA|nr:hypothetical protein TrCOL_g5503 [Triparma columacea]
MIFSNSYHLMLQPGGDVIKDAGGIHSFMGIGEGDECMGPMITDSGGFQVFSLRTGGAKEDLKVEGKREGSFNDKVTGREGEIKRAKTGGSKKNKKGGKVKNGERKNNVRVTEEGVKFSSYRDGTEVSLTPESTVELQKMYGADIIIPLDELPSYDTGRDELVESLERTHRWEGRSLRRHLEEVEGSSGMGQAMYGVVHGGVEKDLRERSLRILGLGTRCRVGGGDPDKRAKPVHLLGIADKESIERTVGMGIDTYDSCFPTRLARHGTLLTKGGKVHIKNRVHRKSYGIPIEEGCQCLTCKTVDRAYMNHLFRANEPAFVGLAVRHNVRFMNDFMEGLREKIMNDEI